MSSVDVTERSWRGSRESEGRLRSLANALSLRRFNLAIADENAQGSYCHGVLASKLL